MEIYKRGQGVWARGLAIIVFLLFAGWGAYELYRIPALLNVILSPDDIVWRAEAEELVDAGMMRIRVSGLANQPVDERLLQGGIKPAQRIETAEGRGLVLPDEDFDKEKLKALLEEGITHVPVVQNEQPLHAVPLTDWLVGRKLAQEVQAGRDIAFEDTKRGEPLTEEQIEAVRAALEAYPEVRVGPLHPSKEEMDGGELPQFLPATELKPGLVPGDTLKLQVTDTLAEPGDTVTPEIFRRMKDLSAKGKLLSERIRIEDTGDLTLEAGKIDEIAGRYLVSERNLSVETWWSRRLFALPLLNVEVTAGLLVSLGVFLVVGGLILYTWNWTGWNDLLIETQTEMKKVSWPRRDELVGSSVVVIVCVVVLGLYLYIVDLLLTKLAAESGLLR